MELSTVTFCQVEKYSKTQLISLTFRNFLTMFFIICVFGAVESNHSAQSVSPPDGHGSNKRHQLAVKYIKSSEEIVEDHNENKFCVWKNMRSYYALCYMYFFKRLTRMAAEYACQQIDGYLAHVVDPGDMPNVKFRWNFTNHYWVGVKLQNHDGCVALTSEGTFEPVSCSARLPYVCMFEDVRTNRELLKEGRVVMKRRSSFHYLAAIMFVAIVFSLPCLILPYTAGQVGEEKNQDEGDGSFMLAEGDNFSADSAFSFTSEFDSVKLSLSDQLLVSLFKKRMRHGARIHSRDYDRSSVDSHQSSSSSSIGL